MSAEVRDRSALELVKKAAWVLPIVYLLFVAFPGSYDPIQPGLDWSWVYALNHLTNAGVAFGRDFAFTYGPLGILVVPLNVGPNLVYSIVFKLIIHAALGAVLFVHAIKLKRPFQVLIFAVAYLAAFVVSVRSRVLTYDYLLLVVEGGLVSVALEDSVPYQLPAISAGILAAAMPFMKFSTGVVALVMLAGLILILPKRIKRNRQFALCAGISYVITAIILSLVFFGSFVNLIGWLRASLSISDGYSVAMSYDAPAWIPRVALAAIAVYLVLTLVVLRLRSPLRYLVLSLSPVVLLAFKSGLVRQDAHVMLFFIGLLSVLAIIVLNATSRRDLVIVGSGIAIVIALAISPAGYYETLSFDDLSGSRGLANIRAVLRFNSTRERLDQKARILLAGDQLPDEWVELINANNSTVDVVPWEITFCPANGLNWSPNPVLQTYAAYTPWLDGRSASHFSGSNAPEYVIASFAEIDARHPLWGSPVTWETILRNYESVPGAQSSRRTYLLHRRPQPLDFNWANIRYTEVARDEWIEVPATRNLLFAEFNMSLTAFGRAAKAVYRIPPVNLDVEYASGKALSLRMIPDTAREGLLINSLPLARTEMEALFRGVTSDQVIRFRFSGPGVSYYSKTIGLNWKEVPANTFSSSSPAGLYGLNHAGLSKSIHVERINSQADPIDQKDKSIVIDSAKDSILMVRGWAIDEQAEDAAGAVYINIDGSSDFEADYGFERKAVAANSGNDRFLRSGFMILLPVSEVGVGRHELALKMVASDRKRYYTSEDRYIIEIR